MYLRVVKSLKRTPHISHLVILVDDVGFVMTSPQA